MEIVLLLVGLCFAIVGALVVLSEARARRGAVEVRAELVGFSTRQGGASGAPSFYAVARYEGLDGQTRYVESSVGSSAPLGAIGDALSVLAQPGDPAKAAVKSSLPSVLGAVFSLMGIVACVAFFRIFRVSTFSVAGAVAFVGLGAWKLRDTLREKPLSPAAWKKYEDELLGTRVFTEETKAGMKWADPAALEAAARRQRKANRFAIPLLVLAGAGLVALGAHLHVKTGRFLERAILGTGKVVELVADRSGDGVTWAPVVELEIEGQKYRFKDPVSSNPPLHRRGEEVGVLYDPGRPADARIDHGWWNKGVPVLVASLGVLFLCLGLWLLFRPSRRAA